MVTLSVESSERVGWNEGLLRKILLRLSEKKLIQLKSVSKRWFSLISDPYFCSLYATKTRIGCTILFTPSCQINYIGYFSIPILPNNHNHNHDDDNDNNVVALEAGPKHASLECSCKGLLLLSSCRDLFVCNPAIDFVTKLPLRPYSHFQYHGSGYYLVFDSFLRSPHYKVVVMRRGRRAVSSHPSLRLFWMDVYSTESREWRYDVANVSLVEGGQFERNGVYWNGAIYWLTNGDYDNVLCFNVDREKFASVTRPHHDDHKRHSHRLRPKFEYLGESIGRLHLVQIYTTTMSEGAGDSTLYVYEMNEEEEWRLVHHSCFDVVFSQFPQVVNELSKGKWFSDKYEAKTDNFILSFVRGDDDNKNEDGSFLVLQIIDENMRSTRVIRYNYVQQSFQHLPQTHLPTLYCWTNSYKLEIQSFCCPVGHKLISPRTTYEQSLNNFFLEHIYRDRG